MKKAGQKLEFFWMDHIWERSAFLKPETVIREENCGELLKKIRCTADPRENGRCFHMG